MHFYEAQLSPVGRASFSILLLWTFRDEVLFDFIEKHSLTTEQFPMKSYFIQCGSLFVLEKKKFENFRAYSTSLLVRLQKNGCKKAKNSFLVTQRSEFKYFCLPIVQTSYLRYKGTQKPRNSVRIAKSESMYLSTYTGRSRYQDTLLTVTQSILEQ